MVWVVGGIKVSSFTFFKGGSALVSGGDLIGVFLRSDSDVPRPTSGVSVWTDDSELTVER